MRNFVPHVALVAWLCVTTTDAEDRTLLTGEAFERQLQTELRVTWENKPLRDALSSLSQVQRIGIMLDRRVDPSVELNVSLRDVSLEEGLQTIAEEQGLGLSFIGPVAYLGPVAATERLATVAMMLQDQAEALPALKRERLLRAESTVWKRLTVPREQCQELARKSGLNLRGLERVPHDVWPEICLPPLSVVQRLTLLLGGFGLTCELSTLGTDLDIVSLPDKASFQKQYHAKSGNVQSTANRLRSRFPKAKIVVASRDRFSVQGGAAVHRAAKMLTGRTRPGTKSVTNTKRVYTFNVENKRGADVLRYLVQQWNLELKIAPSAEKALETTISLSVKDASQEQVMTAILKPLKLRHELQEKRLMVMPE